MQRQGNNLRGYFFCNIERAPSTLLKELEVMPRLPMDTGIYATLVQVVAKVVPPII
jgi:hypothetical protein